MIIAELILVGTEYFTVAWRECPLISQSDIETFLRELKFLLRKERYILK